MARRFHTLDVFTGTALAGNPLAVVLDAEGLDGARMQKIAREFNLSETVFVLGPRDPAHAAHVRIFTPSRELPFAGHPTIGTACLLGHLRAPDRLAAWDLRIVLEEEVGDVVCLVRRNGETLGAEFELPRLPERLDRPPPPAADIAAALGLDASDIGFAGHEPSMFSAGAPFLFVLVRSLDGIRRARPSEALWLDGGPPVFLYSREVVEPGSAFHARMFGGGWGVPEDPATGSAVAAFAGVALAHENLADGGHVLAIEQGIEMGRASRIVLTLAVEGGALRSANIGGSAVIVMSGALEL